MKQVPFGCTGIQLPAIVVGCMRIAELPDNEISNLIHTAIDGGTNFFDHADIYGRGVCEERFGKVLRAESSIRREDIVLQSKCGIVPHERYDQSREYILQSVDGILRRLQTDYIDILLLHRPDALMESDEVAEAFMQLKQSGKVKYFGVSNHKPTQIELLRRGLGREIPIVANQMQFSIAASHMIANGIEVNMPTDGAVSRDENTLDYCRLNDITIQAWSPFQIPGWRGCFIGSEEYAELNTLLREMAEKYGVTPTGIAAAWILRHPAKMQLITGTTKSSRLKEIIDGAEIVLTRQEWYQLYKAAHHPLP